MWSIIIKFLAQLFRSSASKSVIADIFHEHHQRLKPVTPSPEPLNNDDDVKSTFKKVSSGLLKSSAGYFEAFLLVLTAGSIAEFIAKEDDLSLVIVFPILVIILGIGFAIYTARKQSNIKP